MASNEIEQLALRAGIAGAEKVLAEFKAGNLGPLTTWLDLDGAAAYMGVSAAYLCTQTKQGTGPRSIKRGRHRRFKREWLDTWLLASNEDAA